MHEFETKKLKQISKSFSSLFEHLTVSLLYEFEVLFAHFPHVLFRSFSIHAKLLVLGRAGLQTFS